MRLRRLSNRPNRPAPQPNGSSGSRWFLNARRLLLRAFFIVEYQVIDRRISVAPMMDWTDRHCRVFHRMLSERALLYTEMVTAAAVVHGDREKLLGFSDVEQPVAVQLGGSDPALLAEAVQACEDFGYREINLNVGCPSDRVQSGAFGACLMRDPDLVARCVEKMKNASQNAEITVKCRIGVDDQNPEFALRDFIRTVSGVGVRSFTIHARKAWLDGLSPKENRTVPPLNYPLSLAIKEENKGLEVVLNGGIETIDQARAHLDSGFDGVMIGRAAYHDPGNVTAEMDGLFGEAPKRDLRKIIAQMADYADEQAVRGVPFKSISRHMLGLFTGMKGAKAWRRHISENAHLPGATPQVLLDAMALVDLPELVSA